jgi:hypothetical protein
MAQTVLLQELVFFAVACAALVWAQWRLPKPSAPFPGPRPVGSVFKVWLVVIWVVGLVLPLAALTADGLLGGRADVRWALGPYFVMFFAQVASELTVWKRWRSAVWVIVPCLYLPWRLYQVHRGIGTLDAPAPLFTLYTLYALFVLWVINIGVHYTNIPGTLRWDFHAPDSRFPSLRDPRVFTADAQDAPKR